MPFVAKLDDLGSGAWIALTILGFVFWWPIGLALLAFTFWSGRMSCWNGRGMSRWQAKMERMRDRMDRGGDWFGAPTSGNRAFDEYRAETIRRLEDEQREFKDFLERLRMAKDKAEFDQFMAERRGRSSADVHQPSPG
ncbi:DUF2852 domain-containing protein [Rhodoplanes serenus]|uniref:DUF2852 domain-containing protein n=1 Tax=Rhodoplanes serenus TaxID=200615 RepID=A0A447D1I6_9BRAD|nr:DUF2852 domain-containing protein [Rhodoplanes serenus]MBI5114719.1 DUF2852 domain-containing protein [Rhodovulum sp.]MTW18008.1 DUF2852 domain-containing protein [Rhodoplanes serenus]VCU11389.1 hypothetical protein RHODGE_RHODGE_04600 [Rhodoplanes serenus]